MLWRDRAWVIELKTEAGSHRDDQLPLLPASGPRLLILAAGLI
jgi:hypothetical protein